MAHLEHGKWIDTMNLLQTQPLDLSTCEHGVQTLSNKCVFPMSGWTPLAMLEVESSIQASEARVPSDERAPTMMSMAMHVMLCHSGRAVLIMTNPSSIPSAWNALDA